MAEQQESRSLTFNDSDVYDLLEEMAAYLEGHLQVLDAARPPADYLARWDRMVLLAARFISEQPTIQDLLANQGAQQRRPSDGDVGEGPGKRMKKN